MVTALLDNTNEIVISTSYLFITYLCVCSCMCAFMHTSIYAHASYNMYACTYARRYHAYAHKLKHTYRTR